MSLEQFRTQVLLLHSQQSTLDTLSRGFTDRYTVHFANSGSEALTTLGETPIDIIVSAQDLPGMSGVEALREAKKRSPDTIGILLAGDDDDGLEAIVGDKEVFQIIRGNVEPKQLLTLIENAHKQGRLLALAESANDTSADVDAPFTEHIVMETSEHGATIISDGTGQMPALKPEKIQITPELGGRDVDILVLTKDDEFLATIKDSARGLHNVHHAVTNNQADDFIRKYKIGVLVTDAAMSDDSVESLTSRLRKQSPRMVAIVAGRRDDGEMLMDLINRGHVYRFLLKPVSPGRARLAIEASVKHHMEAPEEAFKPKSGFTSLFSRKDSKADAKRKAEEEARRKAEKEAKDRAEAEARAKAEADARRKREEEAKRKAEQEAKERAEAEARAKAEAEARRKAEEDARKRAEEEARKKAEEDARKKAEEEARKKAEAEARKKAEEEARKKAEEEARRKAEEEARRKAEEEARRKAEEEARKKAEEEARRQAEEEARRKAEEEEEARRRAEEEARRKAEEEARKQAEAEARRKAKEEEKQRKAEEKARAKAEAEARKKAKAEAKAKAKAEAKARAQEKAEAKARAKAEAAARKQAEAARKVEPTISDDSYDVSFDDGMGGAFGESTSFTDTMTDIAASVGKSMSGAAGAMSSNAQDFLDTLGDSGDSWMTPRNIGIGAGALIAVAVVGWLFIGGDPETVETVAEQPASIPEPVRPAPQPTFEPPATTRPASGAEPGYMVLLEEARAARAAGYLISPPGDNAVELYVSVAAEAAGDPGFDAEFQAVVNQVLSMAEAAILAGNADGADDALEMARLADPSNSRLTFLRAQVNELLLRDRADQARAAIRGDRFEDAARLISEARSFAGTDTAEIDGLSQELREARSQQQVGATIQTANERLDAGLLVTPANDNARYYFELALSNDPSNQAAQQGLIAVASKLVLQARTAIDSGDLNGAAALLDDARALDSDSGELEATSTALATARESAAAAERAAEAERARQAQLRREEEARQQAEADRRERERIDRERQQAAAAEAAREQAEQQANQAATASPLGVGATAPRTQTPAPAPTRSEPAPSRSQPATSSSSAAAPSNNAPASQPTRTPSTPTPQPAAVQTQSASAVNVQAPPPAPVATGPEQVPVSALTRINYVGPEYPRAARRRNVTGSVDVAFTVTTDGRVRDLSVLKSEPSETFDQAALDAVAQWRFEPVIENGVAVEKRSAVRLAFNLE